MPSMKITRSLRTEPSETSAIIVTAHAGDAVSVLATSGEFKKVRLIDVFMKPEGWVSASAVDEGEAPSATVDKAHFAGECWTQAVFSGANAHYLAAVGELRSRVVNDGKLETGLGLFRLLKEEWLSVWKDDEFGHITEDDLRHWRIQVKVFGLLARHTTDALEKALGKRPTAVQLHLAQLVGVEAFELLEKDPTKTVKQSLEEVKAEDRPPGGLPVDGIVDRHARFLKKDGAAATGEQVTEQIGAALDGALEAMRALVAATGAPLLDDPTDVVAPDVTMPAGNINFDAKTIPTGRKDIAKKIVAAFANAGFGTIQQVTALANAIRESNLNPEASNVTDVESSFGLFQLNTKGGLGTGFSAQQLKQADFNIDIIVKEARKISAFSTVASLIDAMTIFVTKIERPANQNVEIDKRLKIVETLLA
jgi:hypothetical protein